MEIKNEVKVFKIKMICEDCIPYGAEYLPTNTISFSNPPKYEHKCNRCGDIKIFDCVYPKIVYTEIENW